MSRHLVFAAMAVTALASGCGFYTNVPAQVFVATIKPGNITYEPLDTRGVREVKIQNPEVTLRGELGSIGVTFNAMNVKYFLSNGQAANTADLPVMNLGLTFRVDTSNYPGDVNAGPIIHDEIGKKVIGGKTVFELPVVTRHVEQFGLSTSQPDGNAAAVYAQCKLNGYDDANFPMTVEVFCPITFHGVLGQK